MNEGRDVPIASMSRLHLRRSETMPESRLLVQV